MKIIMSVLLSIFILSQQSIADTFEPAFVDQENGLTWSKTLSTEYSNGCVDLDGNQDNSKCTSITAPDGTLQVKVEDSESARACAALDNSRLPTKAEFESLIRKFDHVNKPTGPSLAYEGMIKMKKAFGDPPGDVTWIWTSSVTRFRSSAFHFLYNLGDLDRFPRAEKMRIRCVR